ncbi:MAG TPA: adenylate/guanylate cyclase domain-containing protein [bacterium]|nr:adenylate/guanylate cyclase domain-containing protein [bacterium]
MEILVAVAAVATIVGVLWALWSQRRPQKVVLIHAPGRDELTDPQVVGTKREVGSSLPTGTVTFLFTDIEGSTRLLEHLGTRYPGVLADHHALLRRSFQSHSGHEVGSEGDAFFYSFSRAKEALDAAVDGQRVIAAHAWPSGASVHVRMGLHTGEPLEATHGYIGIDVHRAARICSVGWGGQILASQTTRDLVEDDPSAGITFVDLGEQRLKDLTRPQRLFQVVAPGLPAKFPPLKSLDALPNNLPTQLTSFVGREREIAAVRGLLSTSRLVTLTGPGGTGKTRLALQTAAELLPHVADGVWLVDLAPLSKAASIPQAVASVLNVHRLAFLTEDPTETLLDYLRLKSLLIVLDNCEHLLAGCAGLADLVLQRCPHVRLLATSREGLGITGEAIYPVAPLSLPDSQSVPPAESLIQYEATRLFIERATAAHPGFAPTVRNAHAVVQICTRLDGIPLAIEMAAARVKALSVEEIASRLDDRFRLLTGGSRTSLPRHQTLHATMEWSFDLLSTGEQILFRRLAVFAGGFSMEAVETVCTGGAVTTPDALDMLTHLVEKSLVTREELDGQSRFRFLETVREYARTKLTQSGEGDVVAARHLTFLTDLAELSEREESPPFDDWLDRMDVEHDNLRTAIDWAMTSGHPEWALRLATATWRLWFHRGHLSEGRRTLERALTSAHTAGEMLRARALCAAAILELWQHDFVEGAALCEQALAISKAADDREATALALSIHGHVLWHQGEMDRGYQVADQGVVLARQIGHDRQLLWPLRELSYVLWHKGDMDRGAPLFEEYLALCRHLGNTSQAMDALRLVAEAALHRGDYAEAAALCEQGLALSFIRKDKIVTALLRVCLGHVLQAQGENGRARQLYRETLPDLQHLWQKWWLARCLDGLARLGVGANRYTYAVQLFGAADVMRGAGPPPPSDRKHIDQALAKARGALGEQAFAAAWAEGRSMTVEHVVTHALDEDRP